MKNKFGLFDADMDTIISVLSQQPKVEKAYLFGSRAKGNFKNGSDIDLALKGADLDFNTLSQISYQLNEETTMPYKFDVLNYHTIKEPDLKDHIDRVGIELYSRWKEYKFSELLIDNSISYGIVQPGSHSEINSVPIIRVNNIKNGYIKTDEVLKVSSSIEENYTRTRLVGGELLITVVGSVGECAIVPDNLKGWNVARAVSVARIKKEFDKKFIKYAFKTGDIIFQLYGSTNDTVQPTLNLSSLKDLKFKVPSLPLQSAIASILSSLDDKIDLLHRQNKTLEQLAETLFRQWFVEEAKESWEVGTILELFKLQRGFDLPTQNRIGGKYPIVASSGISQTHNEYKVKAPGVTTGRSGSLGAVFYIEEDYWPLNTSLYVSEFKRATPLFTFFFLKTLDLQSLNGGSAVPTLNRNNVHELETELPPEELIQKFEEIARTYFQKIKSNQTQIRTLTRTRDTLLPKLMSGEVRVKL